MKPEKMKNIKTFIIGLTEEIKADDTNIALYLKRAKAFRKLNDYEFAISDYNKVIDIDSNNLQAFYKKGVTKYITHHYKEAITNLKKAIEIDPDFANAYLKLYDALNSIGCNDEADAIIIKYYEVLGKLNNESIF